MRAFCGAWRDEMLRRQFRIWNPAPFTNFVLMSETLIASWKFFYTCGCKLVLKCRHVARFSCDLTKKSAAAVRSYGRFVIIGFALRRKAGEGHVGRRVNTSGAD